MVVQQCRWNSERFIVFQTVIIQLSKHVNSSGAFRWNIDRRLDAWEGGEFRMPAEDTAHTCAQYISTRRGEYTAEHREKIFHSLVLRDKLRSDFRWIPDREKGRSFQPGDICPKTGKPVFEVLRSNHPGAFPTTAGIFEAYGGKPPEFVPVNVTGEMVASVSQRLLGLARPGENVLVILHYWLLQFESTSAELRNIVGEFWEWMANGRPPWAAYRVLMLV